VRGGHVSAGSVRPGVPGTSVWHCEVSLYGATAHGLRLQNVWIVKGGQLCDCCCVGDAVVRNGAGECVLINVYVGQMPYVHRPCGVRAFPTAPVGCRFRTSRGRFHAWHEGVLVGRGCRPPAPRPFSAAAALLVLSRECGYALWGHPLRVASEEGGTRQPKSDAVQVVDKVAVRELWPRPAVCSTQYWSLRRGGT
jgi:hypothetical protein